MKELQQLAKELQAGWITGWRGWVETVHGAAGYLFGFGGCAMKLLFWMVLRAANDDAGIIGLGVAPAADRVPGMVPA